MPVSGTIRYPTIHQYQIQGRDVSEYDEVRKNLIDMLEELDERLVKITDDVMHSDEPLDKDFEERAVQSENDEVLDYLGNAARAEIAKVKHAIELIDDGEYGVCECCGEPIDKERLKALPYTSLCIKCAQKIA